LQITEMEGSFRRVNLPYEKKKEKVPSPSAIAISSPRGSYHADTQQKVARKKKKRKKRRVTIIIYLKSPATIARGKEAPRTAKKELTKRSERAAGLLKKGEGNTT